MLSWLDALHLGRIEAADKGVDTAVITRCWEKLASLERHLVDQRPWLLPKRRSMTVGIGKEVLKELVNLRLQLNIIPALQSSDFQLISFTSLQVSPCKVNVDAGSSEDEPPPLIEWDAYATLWEDVIYSTTLQDEPPSLVPINVGATSPEEHDDPPPLSRLPFIVVPLALGVNLGEKLSMGVQIQSEPPSAHEGVWFGLEIRGDAGKVLSVFCAPFTGRFMIEIPGPPNQEIELVDELMWPLEDNMCDSVDIYVTVSESGVVEFTRISKISDSMARSGTIKIPVPPWTSQVFAAVRVQRSQVFSKTTISTRFPVEGMLQVQRVDAAWSVE